MAQVILRTQPDGSVRPVTIPTSVSPSSVPTGSAAGNAVSGGVINTAATAPTSQPQSKTPYTDMANAYAQARRDALAKQRTSMTNQLAQSKAGTAANYDSTAAQAYLNYAKQRNALPEQLNAQGINGGASESALVRMLNNYALTQSSNNASRNAAMSQLQNSYDTALAQLESDTEADIMANNLAMAQKQQEYTDTLNQRALEQYQATMERYTSVKSVDKAIAKLDPNDPNYTAKKQLLQLRKAQIKEAKKGSGGGGGGGRSSRRSGSGGSSSGSGGNNNKNNNKTVSSDRTYRDKVTSYYASQGKSSGSRTIKKKSKSSLNRTQQNSRYK